MHRVLKAPSHARSSSKCGHVFVATSSRFSTRSQVVKNIKYIYFSCTLIDNNKVQLVFLLFYLLTPSLSRRSTTVHLIVSPLHSYSWPLQRMPTHSHNIRRPTPTSVLQEWGARVDAQPSSFRVVTTSWQDEAAGPRLERVCVQLVSFSALQYLQEYSSSAASFCGLPEKKSGPGSAERKKKKVR